MQQEKVSVLVCDPQPLVREGITSVLLREPDVVVVGEVGTADEAVEMAAIHAPSVLVLPYKPPAFDGIDVCRRLAQREATRGVGVLLLVDGDAADHELAQALQAGVRGLLCRNTPLSCLVAAVQNMAAGAVVVALPSAAHLLRRISSLLPSRFPERTQATATLTNRELDVLLLVARGCSNSMVAAELTLSTATVKSHLYHLCQKLNLRDRTQVTIFAYETGLITACAR